MLDDDPYHYISWLASQFYGVGILSFGVKIAFRSNSSLNPKYDAMLGELNELEIERLLEQQRLGRIGCHADGLTYIVPINYVYQDGCIYAHSGPGKKIEMLDKNPQVCFQVDDIQDLLNWKSVITWGIYEQITGSKEMQETMQKIIRHIMPAMATGDGSPSHGFTSDESDIGTHFDLVLYKIRLVKKTGRFESKQ